MRLGNEKALVQGLPLSAEGTIFNGETAGTDNQVREVFSKTMNTVYIYIYTSLKACEGPFPAPHRPQFTVTYKVYTQTTRTESSQECKGTSKRSQVAFTQGSE